MARRSRCPTSWSSWIACESERSRPICTVILWCSSGARWREAISRAMPIVCASSSAAGTAWLMMPSASASLPEMLRPTERDQRELLHRQAAVQQRRGDQLPEAAAQNLRHAELRIVGGVDEVVAVHDAERAAEAIAVHLRDHDAREGPHGLGDLDGEIGPVPVEQRAVRDLAQEVEVETRRIDRAGALGDDDLELLVGADDVERFDEGEAERPVPAIALVRAGSGRCGRRPRPRAAPE